MFLGRGRFPWHSDAPGRGVDESQFYRHNSMIILEPHHSVWDFLLPYGNRKAVKKTCRGHVKTAKKVVSFRASSQTGVGIPPFFKHFYSKTQHFSYLSGIAAPVTESRCDYLGATPFGVVFTLREFSTKTLHFFCGCTILNTDRVILCNKVIFSQIWRLHI